MPAENDARHDPAKEIPSPAKRRFVDRAFLASCVIFLVALLPRLYVALAWSDEPVWDGHYYHFGAMRIADGFGYSDGKITPHGEEWHPWCHYPVGYSGFLAVFYALFGATARVGTIVGAFVGAATALVVHRLALHFLSATRAAISGFVCALHPGLILYAGLLMTEPLAALGLLLAPLVYLTLRGKGVRQLVASGLVLGLTTLVRPQTLLLAPLLPLLLSDRSGTSQLVAWRKALVGGVLTLAATLIVVLPWTARNCAVMDGCALVSTNGGWNLAIGSSPHATGRFDGLSGKDGCREVTGQVQQDRCWWDQGVSWIEADPARYLALIPKKLAFTFDHQSFAVGYLAQAEPDRWSEPRRAGYREALGVAQYLLWALGLAAVLPRPRTRGGFDVLRWGLAIVAVGVFLDGVFSEPPTVWRAALFVGVVGVAHLFSRGSPESRLRAYVGALILSLALVHAVFFGEDRYQIVITPALALLAGAAFARKRTAREEDGARDVPSEATAR